MTYLNLTPYRVYSEYTEEHAVPSKDKRYALFEKFLGTTGSIPSTATAKTWKKYDSKFMDVWSY